MSVLRDPSIAAGMAISLISAAHVGRRRRLAEEAEYGPRRRFCHYEWPLQECEMNRQQRRRAERGEVVRRG
jgi:hypothetical protein